MALSAMRSVSRRSASPDRIAAVMSDWIRSRRVTGIGTSGGSPGNRWGWRAVRSVWLDRVGGDHGIGRSPPSSRSALRRPCVLLALRFLALPLHARLLVVLAAASLGEDAGLLDLLVEAAQGAFERLVLTHSDFCQSGIHLLGLSFSISRPAVAQRLGALAPVHLGAGAAGVWHTPRRGSNVRNSVFRRRDRARIRRRWRP